MRDLNTGARLIGWLVIALWLLGAMGWGDFVLRFGPAKPCPAMCQCQGSDDHGTTKTAKLLEAALDPAVGIP